MVLVDIYVPSVDKTYNFSLNETVEVGAIISEITEMVEQKEHVVLIGDRGGMRLYNAQNSMVLPNFNTLADCFVKNGTGLILV